MAKVLYVEDDECWREIVAPRLEREGHQVFLFNDVELAKRFADDNDIDLFLCDGSVKVSGDDLRWAQKLHKDGKKVVVLSGNPPEEVPAFNKGQFKLGNELVAMINDRLAA